MGVVFGAVFGNVFQHGQNFFHRTCANLVQITALLQNFTRYVQRQIIGIDNAFDEAQIHGHQLLHIVHDEHALHIQLHAAFRLAVVHVKRGIFRHIHQACVLVFAFYTEMRPCQSIAKIVRNVFVKLLVLLIADVVFIACPQSLRLVHRFQFIRMGNIALVIVLRRFFHQNRYRNVVAVSGDDAAQSPIAEQIGIVFFNVQGDFGATLRHVDVFNRKFAVTFAHPTHCFIGSAACTTGFHFHFIGHDESRVKAHTELTNQIRVFFCVTRQLLKKCFGARFGNGAQVFNHFITAHAYAIVSDGDGFCCRIAGNSNL